MKKEYCKASKSLSLEEKNCKDYRLGSIYWVNLGQNEGHLQGGWHPAVIVQNNVGNKYSPTISIVPITSSKTKSKLPTHVHIAAGKYGLTRDSVIQCEGQRPIDRSSIGSYLGTLDGATMKQVAKGCLINTPFLFFLSDIDIGAITQNERLVC